MRVVDLSAEADGDAVSGQACRRASPASSS